MRGLMRGMRAALGGAIALAGVAAVCAAGSYWLHRGLPEVRLACADVRGIGEGDLMGMEPSAVLWVDARWEQAHEAGHLAGAVCLNEMNWEAQVSALVFSWRPGKSVVVYADPGDSRAARRVAALARVAIGFEDVAYFDGDWRDLRVGFGATEGAR